MTEEFFCNGTKEFHMQGVNGGGWRSGLQGDQMGRIFAGLLLAVF
jgi:hypothetical protein